MTADAAPAEKIVDHRTRKTFDRQDAKNAKVALPDRAFALLMKLAVPFVG